MSTHGARHIHKYAKGFCECLWYAVRLPDFPIRMLSWWRVSQFHFVLPVFATCTSLPFRGDERCEADRQCFGGLGWCGLFPDHQSDEDSECPSHLGSPAEKCHWKRQNESEWCLCFRESSWAHTIKHNVNIIHTKYPYIYIYIHMYGVYIYILYISMIMNVHPAQTWHYQAVSGRRSDLSSRVTRHWPVRTQLGGASGQHREWPIDLEADRWHPQSQISEQILNRWP